MAIPTWKGDYESVIQVLVSENPKKLGSKARQRFALYRSGMTVKEYIEACKNAPRPQDALIDLTWDSKHRFIKIVSPARRKTERSKAKEPKAGDRLKTARFVFFYVPKE